MKIVSSISENNVQLFLVLTKKFTNIFPHKFAIHLAGSNLSVLNKCFIQVFACGQSLESLFSISNQPDRDFLKAFLAWDFPLISVRFVLCLKSFRCYKNNNLSSQQVNNWIAHWIAIANSQMRENLVISF